MKTTIPTALLAALLVTVDASQLRTTTADNKDDSERRLQASSTILNGLINVFTPNLVSYVQDELAFFDPIVWGNATTVNLGSTDFDGACPSSANITYGVGEINGLSDVIVNRIELVPGSEDISISFLGLDGATWSGDWIFNVSFASILADTTVDLEANLCGFPISQTIEGVTTISNPSVELTVKMEGETGNLFQFQDSSQVNSAVVQTVNLEIGAVDINLGVDGNIVQQLAVKEGLEQTVLTDFSNDIEPLIVNVANTFLAAEAPFGLADDTTSVSRNGPE